jgi:flagellar hook-basal body complex protein FliE
MSLDSLSPITRLQTASAAPRYEPPGVGQPANGFARVLDQVFGEASAADAQAAHAVQDLATGAAEDVHTVALAVAKADLSFRLALELRNRLQEAYQQITQIQV